MKKLLQALLGIGLALGLGEGVARHRDHGGFPHFNGYLADPVLGARLIPDFDTVLAFGDNPPGAIHVNRQGYRGADWPEGGTGETVILGDSQVFGLGVDDEHTLAARLAAHLKTPVLNAGVPTYGPPEYLALIDELAPRKPARIVVVLNFANDLFEIDQPNRGRHVVLDGWALRGSVIPEHVQFPGRGWLYQRSHLVYAARRLLYDPTGDAELADVEGVRGPPELPEPAAPAQPVAEAEIHDAVRGAVRDLQRAEDNVIRALLLVDPDAYVDNWEIALEGARDGKGVGDIVGRNYAEASVRVQITADWLSAVTRLQREAPQRLRTWLETHPRHRNRALVEERLATLETAKAALAALDGASPRDGGRPSAFRGFLLDARQRAARAGAELVVVALPLDVQVDPQEFVKYGEEPRDLSATLGLLDDLCADATHLGVRCLNPTEALRAAQPGVFLRGDLHLTAHGQDTLAAALAETLAAPAPAYVGFAGLPAGRTRVPTDEEWSVVPENYVKGSSRYRCHTAELREYLLVRCGGVLAGLSGGGAEDEVRPGRPLPLSYDAQLTYSGVVQGVAVIEGPLDHRAWVGDGVMGLVIPRLPERRIVADLIWSSQVARLTVEPGPRAEGEPVGMITPVAAAGGPPETGPRCGPDQIQGGATGACLSRCDADQACAAGVCTDWQGLSLCI